MSNLNLNVSQLWDATETMEKTAATTESIGFFTRDRIRQECVMDRVIAPQFVTQNDIERNTDDDSPAFRVGEGLVVVAPGSDRCVEDLDGFEVEGVEDSRANPRAPSVEWVGRDCDSTGGFHRLHHLAGRRSFEEWQGHAEADQVPLRRAHLDARNDQKACGNGASLQILVRLTRVVVGDRDPAEPPRPGGFDQRLDVVADVDGEHLLQLGRYSLWSELRPDVDPHRLHQLLTSDDRAPDGVGDP